MLLGNIVFMGACGNRDNPELTVSTDLSSCIQVAEWSLFCDAWHELQKLVAVGAAW